MSEPVRRHRKNSQAHRDAENIILRVIAANGELHETNADIAAALGIEEYRVGKARRHTQHPLCDLDVVIAYRGIHEPLTILDKKGANATLKSPEERAGEMVKGHRTRKQQQDTEREYMVDQWTAIADDADQRGKKALYRACTEAAAEVRVTGELSIRMEKRLRKLGVNV